MRLKSVVFLLTAVLILAAGWSAFWWFSSQKLQDGFAAWQAERAAEGTRVSYGAYTIGGYPFSLVLSLSEPEISRSDGLAWSAARLRGEAELWSPLTIDLDAPGRHGLSLPVSDGVLNLDLLTAQSEGVLRLTARGEVESFSAELAGVEISEYGGPVTTAELVRVEVGRGTAAPNVDTSGLPVDIWAERLHLPEQSGGYPLGRAIERMQATLGVQGGPLVGAWPDAATAWSAAGGVVNVSEFRLLWGPLDLGGEGAVTLDQWRRPLGAFTARIVGYLETVDALAKGGIIELGDASILKLGGLALAKTNTADATGPSLPFR